MHTRNRNPMLRWQDPPSSDEDDSSSEPDSTEVDEDQGSTECIELLSDEDEDVDVIEILSSDLEDDEEEEDEDEDIQIIDVTTPAPMRTRHAVLDLCASQVKTYLEDDATQRQVVYQVYVDGSHRPSWPVATSMSAGGYCLKPPAPWFDFSCLLLGGKPGSLCAELGAVWVGCGRLSKAISERRVLTASSKINMYTDCTSVALLLKRERARVPPQYRALVTGIKAQLKRLKQLLPVRLSWVKGHQTVDCEHKRGNDAADSRAQPHNLTTCELLPSNTAGARAPDQAAAKAAWQKLLRERARREKRQAKWAQKHQQAGRLQPWQMKRRGEKGKRRVRQQAAAAWWQGCAPHEQQPSPPPPWQQQAQPQQWQPQQWQPPPQQQQAQQQQKQPPWLFPPPQQQHGLVPGAGAPPPPPPPPPAAAAATSAVWQQPPLGMAMQSRPLLAAAAAAAPRAPPPPLPPMRQPACTQAAVVAAAAVALPESPVWVVAPAPKPAPVVICIDC